MASINDVAKMAGVSKSTVSLVINNTGYVSKNTRIKVEKAMKELNYIPNKLAQNLSNKKSNIIGIVMPDILHPFFSTFIKYAEKFLYDNGYMTMVCSTVGSQSIEEKYLDMLERKAMDGIIMGSHSLNISRYKKTTRPIVSIDRFLDEHIPLITSNNKQASQLVINHLKDNKCKKIIQIIGGNSPINPKNDFPTFCKELAMKFNMELLQLKLPPNSFSNTDYEKIAVKIFENYDNFDAIIGVDLAILACEKIATSKNIKIPQELKLISYDGTYITRIGKENITSVYQPVEEFAKLSVDTIITLIEKKEVKEFTKILDVKFFKGDTTF